MIRILLFLFLAGMAFPAFAQEVTPVVPALDPEICKFLVTHQPDADVNYTPGVDVHGKPVVEADVDGSFFIHPDEITFPVTVDLARYAGLAVPEGTEAKAGLGTVNIDRDGIVTFNGQPMQGESEAALRGLCNKSETSTETQVKSDNQ